MSDAQNIRLSGPHSYKAMHHWKKSQCWYGKRYGHFLNTISNSREEWIAPKLYDETRSVRVLCLACDLFVRWDSDHS